MQEERNNIEGRKKNDKKGRKQKRRETIVKRENRGGEKLIDWLIRGLVIERNDCEKQVYW